jgi:hypothetical protein
MMKKANKALHLTAIPLRSIAAGELCRSLHIKRQIMAESILIVNRATRINGNTDILVGKISDGAKNAGLNLNLVELKNKNISNESKECGF